MRTCTGFQMLAVLGLVMMATACGGEKPPEPAAPKAAVSASAAPTTAKETPEKKPSKAPVEEKPAKKPHEMLTDPDVTFVLAFDKSEPGKEADEKCKASSKNNEQKFNECMAKAREKIPAEAIRFKEEGEQNVLWLTLRQKGPAYAVVNKVEIEFADETDRSIVLKPKGKGTTAKETRLDIVSEFSIALKDPKFGRLVYDVRLGIAGQH